MKKRILAFICLCAMLMSLLSVTAAAAENDIVDWDSLCTYGDPSMENTKISVQELDGKDCLVLPSNLSPSSVTFGFEAAADSTAVSVSGAKKAVGIKSGAAVDLNDLCGEGSRYELTFRALAADGSTSQFKLTVLRSANVAAMYLVSSDPVNEGREWIESSPDKSNRTTGSMVLQAADGVTVYDSTLSQIKGRGNSTWAGLKKPYQIKLDDKTDLLQTGSKDNRAKTWVLLANYNDRSLLRNTVALNLGNEMGMDVAVENRYVDLYYDGEFRGNYLLSEKVEVGSGRVDITDLEDANEGANSGIEDFEALPVGSAKTANGATYTYCEGMKSPEDITGGYLLEMEVANRTAAEICYFYTTRNNHVVVKSPECASKEEMEYIATLYQEYEDALFSGGVNPDTGKHYTDYVDLKSTVECYLINELSKNLDGFRTSAYLYKEAGVDQMKMGPLWDYDLSFGAGVGTPTNAAEQIKTDGLYTARSIFGGQLYKMADFRLAVKQQYADTLYPLLRNVLMGDVSAVGANGALHSMAWYRGSLAQSAALDFIMWRDSYDPDVAWLGQADNLKSYIDARSVWLKDTFDSWNAESYDPLISYLDVKEDDWFFENVMKVTDYSLMQGTGMSMFSPEAKTNRAQVAQVIYNMSAEGEFGFEQLFSDVSRGAWFASAVTWCADKGYVKGYPDGSFKPNDNILRQDLVVILYRHAGSPAVSGNKTAAFTDAGDISSYAAAAMEWAVENGMLSGYPDGSVKPQGLTTRAELAKILQHYYEDFVLT